VVRSTELPRRSGRFQRVAAMTQGGSLPRRPLADQASIRERNFRTVSRPNQRRSSTPAVALRRLLLESLEQRCRETHSPVLAFP
jgi:hypothetical protein